MGKKILHKYDQYQRLHHRVKSLPHLLFFFILLWGDRIFLKEYIDAFPDKINVPSRRFSPVDKIPPSTITCSSLLVFSLTFLSVTPFAPQRKWLQGWNGCKKCALSLFLSVCPDRLRWQWEKAFWHHLLQPFCNGKTSFLLINVNIPSHLHYQDEKKFSLSFRGGSKTTEFFFQYIAVSLSYLFFEWLWACVREARWKICRFFPQALVAALFHVIALRAEAGA